MQGYAAGTYGKGKGKSGDDRNEVVIKGLSFDLDDATLRNDFEECGELDRVSMPRNEIGKPKGIAFIQFRTKEGVRRALERDGTEYFGRTIYVTQDGDKGKGKGKGKDKGKDKGKGGGDSLNVFIRGLSWDLDDAALWKDFEECGELDRVSMPRNEMGKPKGIAFMTFKTQEGVRRALELDGTEHWGRTIYVTRDDPKGKGKGGKGKL